MRKFVFGFTAIAVVALLGCASANTSTEQTADPTIPRDQAVVEIQNNRVATTDVRVFIEPDGGIRSFVGQVASSQTGRFQYRAQPASYVLVAETATGAAVRSEPFTMRAGQIARWNMQTNRVLVTDR